MDVKLVVSKGPARQKTFQLRSAETVIGRRRDCDLCIPSAEVSRRHCLLSFSNGRLTVEDLDSANGTYVNDEKVSGKKLVRPSDELRIGPLTFTVQYEGAAELAAPKKAAGKKKAGAANPFNFDALAEVESASPADDGVEIVEELEPVEEVVELEEAAVAPDEGDEAEVVVLEEEPAADDGVIVIEEEIPEEDVIVLDDVVAEKDAKKDAASPASSKAKVKETGDDAFEVVLEEDAPMHLPEGGELRDLLSEMDK